MLAKVSLIMCVYNNEPYLEEAIESVLKLEYNNKEIIIVDDKSTDRSVEIIKKYVGHKAVSVIYHEENRGVQNTLKSGIQQATGEYIFLAAGDDITLPERVKRCLEVWGNNKNVGVICSEADIIDEHSLCTGMKHRIPEHITNTNIGTEQFKRNYCLGATLAFVNDKKILLDPDVMKYMDDFELALDYLINGYTIYIIKESLILYRKHGQNQTVCKVNELKERAIKVYKKYDDDIILQYLATKTKSNREKYTIIGIIKCFIEDYEAAVKYLMKGCSDKVNAGEGLNVENKFYTSVAFYYLGNKKQALEELLECEKNRKRRAEIYNNIAVILVEEEKNLERAKVYLQKAVDAREGYKDAEYNLEQIMNTQYKLKFTSRIMDINY